MKRYFRSRSRIFGAIGQPLLFLLALGYGLGAVYEKAGQGDYLQFLVPGIIVQTLLFSGVFWGIQILCPRCAMYHAGNLRFFGCCCRTEVKLPLCTSPPFPSDILLSSGVMRITVTVVVIMFELTGALTYILPTMVSYS